jgi:hypothetical protein
MWRRMVVMGVLLLTVVVFHADAATWSRGYVRQLPDSAFAVIEQAPEGKPLRRLPHHDATGALDLPHLCNALARLPQVKWRDAANAQLAQRHLRDHLKQVRAGACRPAKRAAGNIPVT